MALSLELVLTPGQAGDCPVASITDASEAAGAAFSIPPIVDRCRKPCFSLALY
jgi:hypothetical protein